MNSNDELRYENQMQPQNESDASLGSTLCYNEEDRISAVYRRRKGGRTP